MTYSPLLFVTFATSTYQLNCGLCSLSLLPYITADCKGRPTSIWAVQCQTHSPDGGAMQCIFRPKQHRSKSASLVALLLLLSAIETNPGPIINTHTLQSIRGHANIGGININLVFQKGSLVIDLIIDHSLDALAVCETEIMQDDRPAIKRDCVPSGYDVLHLHRPGTTKRSRIYHQGGLCFIYWCNSMLVKRCRLQCVLK